MVTVEFIEQPNGEADTQADPTPFMEVYNVATNANARIAELEAQLAEAERQRDNCNKAAIEIFGSSFCDTHGEKVKGISFPAFHEWMKEMGCQACASERASRLEAALKAVEWRVSGCHLQCPWCHGIKEYEGHRPNCARQLALGGAKEGE